jgi:hypothetical protein
VRRKAERRLAEHLRMEGNGGEGGEDRTDVGWDGRKAGERG